MQIHSTKRKVSELSMVKYEAVPFGKRSKSGKTQTFGTSVYTGKALKKKLVHNYIQRHKLEDRLWAQEVASAKQYVKVGEKLW